MAKRARDFCPKCKVKTEYGFGFAGGRYGPYSYCPQCGDVPRRKQREPEGVLDIRKLHLRGGRSNGL